MDGATQAALELLAADLADPEVASWLAWPSRGAALHGPGRVAPLPPSLQELMGTDLFHVDPFGGSFSGLDPFSGDPFVTWTSGWRTCTGGCSPASGGPSPGSGWPSQAPLEAGLRRRRCGSFSSSSV